MDNFNKYDEIITGCDEDSVFVGDRECGYHVHFSTKRADAIMHVKETLDMVKDACRYLGITIEDLEKDPRDQIIKELNVPGSHLIFLGTKSACPDCRDLPEGEVIAGHDHRTGGG